MNVYGQAVPDEPLEAPVEVDLSPSDEATLAMYAARFRAIGGDEL